MCVKCFSKCPGFFCYEEMNDNKYTALTFTCFLHYEHVSSCYFHKYLLPDHGKTCLSFMNLENVDKGKVTPQKSLVLK